MLSVVSVVVSIVFKWSLIPRENKRVENISYDSVVERRVERKTIAWTVEWWQQCLGLATLETGNCTKMLRVGGQCTMIRWNILKFCSRNNATLLKVTDIVLSALEIYDRVATDCVQWWLSTLPMSPGESSSLQSPIFRQFVINYCVCDQKVSDIQKNLV